MDSEKLVDKRLRIEVEKLGGWAIKLSATHISGLPDRLCLLPGGRVVFVEVKTTGQKPRKIQLYVHNKLRRLGFRVEVIDSTEKVKQFIKNPK